MLINCVEGLSSTHCFIIATSLIAFGSFRTRNFTQVICICRSLVFHDFIAKCLTKEPRLRPTATEMLKVCNICYYQY